MGNENARFDWATLAKLNKVVRHFFLPNDDDGVVDILTWLHHDHDCDLQGGDGDGNGVEYNLESAEGCLYRKFMEHP